MKRLSFGLVVLVFLSLLAACGGAGAPAKFDQVRNGLDHGGGSTGGSNAQQFPTTGASATSAPAPTTAALQPMTEATAPLGGAPAPAPTQAPPTSAEAATAAATVEPGPSNGTAPADTTPADSVFFQNYGTNPFVETASDPQSTFAMDIDTASYTVMRNAVNSGILPDPNSVRPEEYVNFFDYQYPQPESGDFAIYTEAGPSPFGGPQYQLVQIGIQGKQISAAQRKPAALTFVIDSSGSMQQEDRLEVVKQAMAMLTEEMRPDDTIAIVTYGSEGRVVLPPTGGAEKATILGALNSLYAEGSTNAQGGLEVGFQQADAMFGAEKINMILLCSDGVANNGITDPDGLLERNRQYLDKGIQVSTFGFGMGNFNDVLMEQLANKGDGAYAYIDSLDEARRVFIENLTGTLQTIARDAKIQVEFNPNVVTRYRLIGYENRDVADRDFRNDTVDAGEVGAGHSVTALYEIRRVDGADGEVATVRIRYQKPDSQEVVEQAQGLSTDLIRGAVGDTTPRFKLAASVAQYAELMRYSFFARGEELDQVVALAESGAEGFNGAPDAVEFVSLLKRAVQLAPAKR
ncbi:MAG TPA: von Willebrand factor type A domain-containing protein [Herpetosiphonaceae bacterium]